MKDTLTSLIIGGIIFLVIVIGGTVLYVIQSKKSGRTKKLLEKYKDLTKN